MEIWPISCRIFFVLLAVESSVGEGGGFRRSKLKVTLKRSLQSEKPTKLQVTNQKNKTKFFKLFYLRHFTSSKGEAKFVIKILRCNFLFFLQDSTIAALMKDSCTTSVIAVAAAKMTILLTVTEYERTLYQCPLRSGVDT